MKKLFVVALIFLSISSFAQKIFPEESGSIIYSGVVTVDSVKKDELYVRAKKWFVDTYNSAKNVLQMEDKEAGIIVGKGLFDIPYSLFIGSSIVSVSHTIKIYTKDGKYKYEVTDISGKHLNESGWHDIDINNQPPIGNKTNKIKMLNDTNKKILSIIESLKEAMLKPLSTKDF